MTLNSTLQPKQTEGDVNTTHGREEWIGQFHDDETRRLLDEDSRYFFHQSLSTPCLNVLAGCKGTTITDIKGRQFLDFHGNCVHQTGFAPERVITSVKKQLDELCFSTRRYTNKPAIELAKKLTSITPGNLEKILFAPGGTLVNGMAIKLARAVTGRHKVISLWDSFHGASLDMISIAGESLFRQNIGPLMTGTEHVPPPDCYRCIWGCKQDSCNLKCADYVEYVLEKEGDIGAFIGETIRSTHFVPRMGYWQRIREICDHYGVLLILDEIPHCLGRTGKMFSCENYDIVPDILTIGKGLGAGIYPFAAMIARPDLDILPNRALGHYTHEKNPVACRAALENIAIIEEDITLEYVNQMGQYTKQRLTDLMKKHELVGDIRGIGLMMSIELVKDRKTKEKAIEKTEKIMYISLTKGLNFKTSMGNVITLTPPLNVTMDEIDRAVDILDECFTEVC